MGSITKLFGACWVGVFAAGCAHVEFKAPDDPVEEARLRLADITGAEGNLVCAASEVEGDRGLEALQSLGPEYPLDGSRTTSGAYNFRQYQYRQLNLSQASALLSQSLDNYNTAQTNIYNGVPNAHAMARGAMSAFDAAHSTIVNPNPQRRRGPTRTERSMASAQYAMVWTEYFSMGDDPGFQGQLLDWLTTRSMDNFQELRSYHRDFHRALKRKCG